MNCVSPPPNATNLNASDRVTGGQLPPNYYLIFCGEEEPFFDGEGCLNCFHPQSLFNLSSHKCEAAPPNQTNPEYLQLVVGGRIEVDEDFDYFCEDAKPFFWNSSCLSCHYPVGLFNLSSHQCVSPPPNASNELVENRIMGGVEALNSFSIRCPSDRPFFKSPDCVDCLKPENFFDLRTMECRAPLPNKTNPKYFGLVAGSA